ncbi:copper transport protein ATOX1 [Takifugu flavidus]|uniref:copper transport protein ATOX1 n=1 Tax=Takifugu flavidus TaxID=433684 RepID=UPI002544117E|nr:copper transport protein ATOX1 [Takifugu flavidus]
MTLADEKLDSIIAGDRFYNLYNIFTSDSGELSQLQLCHVISNMTRHEFEVAMTCEGCSGAVSRILNKLGVETFEIDLPKKLVWIESDKDVQVLTEALKKSGKEVKYVGTK